MSTRTNKKTGFAQRPLSRMLPVMMYALFLSLAHHPVCCAESVALSWNPNVESDLAGYKVYYKADVPAVPFDGTEAAEGASPVDVHNQATAVISGLDPGKTHYFAVTAYNTSGVESDYSSTVTILESVAPLVAISSPAANAAVSGTVVVAAGASDNVGVAKVEFSVNGILQATETIAPYAYSWNTASLSSGSYILTAKAYDAAGNVGLSEVAVTVVNDTTAPSVALTAPAGSSTVSGTVAVTASAGDNVGVTLVEFHINGELFSAGNEAPYTFNWNTASAANGSYTLTAKAYDGSGNSRLSAAVQVTVFNDFSAPAVTSFTMPATATSKTVAISTFTASDNVGVTGYLVSESAVTPAVGASGWKASAPTSFTFSSTGSRTAYAWVKDAAGNISAGSSAAVFIQKQSVRRK